MISEICQKVGSLDGKMTQNPLKTYSFSFFSQKITTFKVKITCYKNRYTSQFHAFKIKNDFKNMSESGEF